MRRIEIQMVGNQYAVCLVEGTHYHQQLGPTTDLLSLAEARGQAMALMFNLPFFDYRTSVENRIFQLTSV